MDFSDVIRKAEDVLQVLEQYQHEESAAQLKTLMSQLSEPWLQKQALQGIEDMCHIKWLGDLNTGTISLKKWWALLERLRVSANRCMRQLETP